METIEICGANRFETYTKTREASRGIVLEEGKILLSYETKTDQWFLPGGGVEAGESAEVCCMREIAEETGCVVEPLRMFLTINEYYEEWRYASRFFVCRPVGSTERSLTAREKEAGLEPRWIPLQEAVSIFSLHERYAEEKRGAYLREYTALQAYLRGKD